MEMSPVSTHDGAEEPSDSQQRRSKNGCWTCKVKKVKCDENQPCCERCLRLKLTCSWKDPRPPLAERRRQRGSVRKEWKWVSSKVPPKSVESEPVAEHDTDDQNFDTVHDSSIIQDQDTSEINPGWWTSMLADPWSLESLQSFEGLGYFGDFINPITRLSNSSNDDAGEPLNVPILPSGRGPRIEMVPGFANRYTNAMNIPDAYLPVSTRPQVSSTDAPTTPASIAPDQDWNAYHYQTALNLSINTTKDPSWNTFSVILCLGYNQPMVMHFLIAASLRMPVVSNGNPHSSEISAEEHFAMGTQLLTDTLDCNQTPAMSVTLLTAFYLMFMYRSTIQTTENLQESRNLSKSTLEYIRKEELMHLCMRTTGKPKASVNAVLSWQDRTLLARVIVWIFYVDLLADFRNHGGYIAKYLRQNEKIFAKIYSISRSALHANWDKLYPIEQLIDDVENSMALELQYELYVLTQKINESSASLSHNNEIQEEFQIMEERYKSLFLLTVIEKHPRPRLLQTADYIVSTFHAARIYSSWYKTSYNDNPCAESIEASLNAMLKIMYNNFANGRPRHQKFQWPFLIAGAETEDSIHRDWILRQMSPDPFKIALEKIVVYRKQHGCRPDVSWIRNIFSGADEVPIQDSTTFRHRNS